MLQFRGFGGIFWHILKLYVTFWLFFCTIWAFYAVLSRIRFVVIYAIFWVKYLWLKPCLCKQIVFLHVWFSLYVAMSGCLSVCLTGDFWSKRVFVIFQILEPLFYGLVEQFLLLICKRFDPQPS